MQSQVTYVLVINYLVIGRDETKLIERFGCKDLETLTLPNLAVMSSNLATALRWRLGRAIFKV
jgi:hypothetical protein